MENMKTARILMVVSLLVLATSASAQLSSNPSSTSDTDGWNSVWVEWNPSTFKVDVKDADNQSFTGISAGYSQSFNVVPLKPVFMEFGIGVQYSFYEEKWKEQEYYEYEDEYYWSTRKQSLDLWSVKIPVNLTYKYNMPNGIVSLLPFVGANVRFNLIGKRHDYIGYKTLEKNVFDKDDMDGSKNTYNRFQLGWNIGVKAIFGKHIMAGLSYGNDFSEIAKKTTISTTTISLGYAF